MSYAANIQSFDTTAPAMVTARYPATVIAPDASEFDGAFVMPNGWSGRWHMKTRFKKQLVAYTSEQTSH